MKLNRDFIQRIVLALTLGIFLSCAAQVSYEQAATGGSSAFFTAAP